MRAVRRMLDGTVDESSWLGIPESSGIPGIFRPEDLSLPGTVWNTFLNVCKKRKWKKTEATSLDFCFVSLHLLAEERRDAEHPSIPGRLWAPKVKPNCAARWLSRLSRFVGVGHYRVLPSFFSPESDLNHLLFFVFFCLMKSTNKKKRKIDRTETRRGAAAAE